MALNVLRVKNLNQIDGTEKQLCFSIDDIGFVARVCRSLFVWDELLSHIPNKSVLHRYPKTSFGRLKNTPETGEMG
jgi:hypothetical protein